MAYTEQIKVIGSNTEVAMETRIVVFVINHYYNCRSFHHSCYIQYGRFY